MALLPKAVFFSAPVEGGTATFENIGGLKPGDAAVVIDSQKQPATAAVGKSSQFGGEAIGINGISLELAAAVFTAGEDVGEFGTVSVLVDVQQRRPVV